VEPDLSAYFLWNVDPVMFRIAGRGVRWYSFFYFLVFLLGYALWHWQMLRGGHDAVPTSRLLLWMLVGLLTSARLGHCLFYEPEFYLSHPLEILNLSRGGVSSHGGTIGIFVTLALYARRYDFSPPEVADRISFATMFGAALVRFGNVFNSEIVGREWYGPWAVRFPRFSEHIQKIWERTNEPLGWTAQPLPRHPVQLYEALGIWCVLAVLFAVDRRYGEGRPRGLLAGLFCCLYFVVRFIVEYWKEYLRFHEFVPDAAEHVIRVVPTAGLTLGQWLSLPFIVIGAGIIVWSLRTRLPASRPSRFDVAPDEP
jgi:phosphatidylglycerol:prolipoprotein diacylglycerol transferase